MNAVTRCFPGDPSLRSLSLPQDVSHLPGFEQRGRTAAEEDRAHAAFNAMSALRNGLLQVQDQGLDIIVDQAFLDLLDGHEDFALFHYGSYERRLLKRMKKLAKPPSNC